jgi:MinD superfamily P-loop ATPase
VAACPARAIRFEPVVNGEWYESGTRFGPMIHARLHPGEENSGKLVSTVRREARRTAVDRGLPLVLVDGSPGVGCPVIASLTGAHLALVVAEPTPSGRHDALRVIDLARRMDVPVVLCVNRWDLNPALAAELENEAAVLGVSAAGRVREDRGFVDAQMQGRSLVEHRPAPAARDLHALWSQVRELFDVTEHEASRIQPQAGYATGREGRNGATYE